MNDKSKGRGSGDKCRDVVNLKKAGSSHDAMVKRQGNQGRGGGLSTSHQVIRRSTRLSNTLKDKDVQANAMVDNQASNPFYVLQMEEDEEPEDDEESEEINDMQTSPAHSASKIPQRRTQKRSEREDSSVGSMRRPTKGGKLEVLNVIDKVVESEIQQMEMDVSTITDFPEDDDLFGMEEAKEDEFQYEDNPGRANMIESKISHNQENILDPEKSFAENISETLQEPSQTSDEEEWDDTNLKEQTRAEFNGRVTAHAHLARSETQTQAGSTVQTTPEEQERGSRGHTGEGQQNEYQSGKSSTPAGCTPEAATGETGEIQTVK